MSKILFVTPQFKSGGGNRVFVELANSIARFKGNLVEIIYPNNSLETSHYKVESDINIKVIGEQALSNFSKLYNCYLLFCFILKELKQDEETTVVISDSILCLFLFVIPKKAKMNIVRFIQADDYRIFDDLFVLKNRFFLFLFKLFTRFSYTYKCKYIFNSSFSYDCFIKVSKRKDVPQLIVHPAVDQKVFCDLETGKPQGNEKISICLIARDHPLKKLDDFIAVWGTLSTEVKNKINQVNLISHDTLDKFDLKGLHIIRPKTDKEIADVFRESDIFISTSLWEGFSLPPLEAMNCGLTILSSDSGGIREYAINEHNSLLYSPGNRAELGSKLERLIADKNLRLKLKVNAKETVKNFSWDRSALKLLSVVRG